MVFKEVGRRWGGLLEVDSCTKNLQILSTFLLKVGRRRNAPNPMGCQDKSG